MVFSGQWRGGMDCGDKVLDIPGWCECPYILKDGLITQQNQWTLNTNRKNTPDKEKNLSMDFDYEMFSSFHHPNPCSPPPSLLSFFPLLSVFFTVLWYLSPVCHPFRLLVPFSLLMSSSFPHLFHVSSFFCPYLLSPLLFVHPFLLFSPTLLHCSYCSPFLFFSSSFPPFLFRSLLPYPFSFLLNSPVPL